MRCDASECRSRDRAPPHSLGCRRSRARSRSYSAPATTIRSSSVVVDMADTATVHDGDGATNSIEPEDAMDATTATGEHGVLYWTAVARSAERLLFETAPQTGEGDDGDADDDDDDDGDDDEDDDGSSSDGSDDSDDGGSGSGSGGPRRGRVSIGHSKPTIVKIKGLLAPLSTIRRSARKPSYTPHLKELFKGKLKHVSDDEADDVHGGTSAASTATSSSARSVSSKSRSAIATQPAPTVTSDSDTGGLGKRAKRPSKRLLEAAASPSSPSPSPASKPDKPTASTSTKAAASSSSSNLPNANTSSPTIPSPAATATSAASSPTASAAAKPLPQLSVSERRELRNAQARFVRLVHSVPRNLIPHFAQYLRNAVTCTSICTRVPLTQLTQLTYAQRLVGSRSSNLSARPARLTRRPARRHRRRVPRPRRRKIRPPRPRAPVQPTSLQQRDARVAPMSLLASPSPSSKSTSHAACIDQSIVRSMNDRSMLMSLPWCRAEIARMLKCSDSILTSRVPSFAHARLAHWLASIMHRTSSRPARSICSRTPRRTSCSRCCPRPTARAPRASATCSPPRTFARASRCISACSRPERSIHRHRSRIPPPRSGAIRWSTHGRCGARSLSCSLAGCRSR